MSHQISYSQLCEIQLTVIYSEVIADGIKAFNIFTMVRHFAVLINWPAF